MCKTFHSKQDDAFRYFKLGASFYGDPEYEHQCSTRTLKKAVSDFSDDPNTMSFKFVLPDRRSAPWHSLSDQFLVVKTYPKGSCSCPADVRLFMKFRCSSQLGHVRGPSIATLLSMHKMKRGWRIRATFFGGCSMHHRAANLNCVPKGGNPP